MKIDLKCHNCDSLFTIEYKRRNTKFCGRKCYFEYGKKNKTIGRKIELDKREKKICLYCKNEFIDRKKNEKKLCSEECRKNWQSMEINKNKRIELGKKAFFEKYGVDSIFKLDDFKNNLKSFYLKKYGVESPMYVDQIVDKIRKKMRDKQIDNLTPKLFKNNLILLDEYTKNKNGNTSLPYNFKCLKCDNIFTSTLLGGGKIPICRKCNPIVKNSKIEIIIRDFLNDKGIKHIDNNKKTLGGLEIDMLLPDFNLGLEINGNYYHSEKFGNKNKEYHINKTKLSYQKNIKLIHIFEDEITYKKELVLSNISNILDINQKINTTNFQIKFIDKNLSKKFNEDNNIIDNSTDTIFLGLFINDELMSIMSFKDEEKNIYRVINYCDKKYFKIENSFENLLKFFIENYKPKTLYYDLDIRWYGIENYNNFLIKNRFKFIDFTEPNPWFLKINKFNKRYDYSLFNEISLSEMGNNSILNEKEFMLSKGYDVIWDCGKMKFELSLY